ncbi:MAG: FKBP-type peptidyl-prolyl cis-trans isomerase [Gammaproteobacteria bacterium]|nr:FKBP-type peptidyl-prolyl cis-trans isomerase [Gammaproteobacteria bacterium]MCW5583842.1 FKBP-type peptidyl-prolyl cis-trans isomerase [Gammaproteobacteria bacterium]
MKNGVAMKSLIISIIGLGLMSANSYAVETQGAQPTTGTQMQSTINQGNVTSESFLEANKSKPGVVILPSGLQYKIIKEGNGSSPTINDTVTVNYSGTLIDGTEFDSSYKRGEPATFPVSGVIPGWTEALQLMKVGSTWELYIPASLAYGATGAPPVIGPNQTLIFKVELLGINK